MFAPAQHDHTPITFSFTTGPDSVRMLVIAGALLVTAAAFVRPFVTLGRTAQLAVIVAAGSGVLLLLLLVDGLDMPQQAIVAVLVAAALPLVVARHDEGDATPFARVLRRAAPWVVGVAGTFAAVELARVPLLNGDPAGELRLVHTSIAVGLVGLAWLVLCRPAPLGRGTVPSTATNVGGWLLGNVVLAGVVAVAVLGIA